MDFLSSAAVSLFLLLCAAGLMWMHVRTWQGVKQQRATPEEIDYRYRQFRRRMQSSALLAVSAVAVFIGQWIPLQRVILAAVFWGGVVLLLVWVGLLALVDIWATKHYFGRLRQTYVIEQAKLQAEIRRIRAMRGNGKAADHDADIDSEKPEDGAAP